MNQFKQSRPLSDLVKTKTFTDVIVLFMHQYGYNLEQFAKEVNINPTTLSNKLKTGLFIASERITITNFIRSKV